MTAPPLLLIEDLPSLQMVYESVLRSGGHQVRSKALRLRVWRRFTG